MAVPWPHPHPQEETVPVNATTFYVPHGPAQRAWADRVNERARRVVVTTTGGRHTVNDKPLKAGQILLILDGPRVSQPVTYRVLDSLEQIL